MKTAKEIREALIVAQTQAKELKKQLVASLPVGSLKPNGKHRKAMLQAIAEQESFRSVGLNEEFRLPTVEDSGWSQKQLDSLNTSLENAVAKRTKLLTSQKAEIAKDIARKETQIERWKIDTPRNDGKCRKHVVYVN